MKNPSQFSQMVLKIIKRQEPMIGSLAWDEAKMVAGLTINRSNNTITFKGDERDIINRLVSRYVDLFGRASYEVCKEVVQDLIDDMLEDEIPSIFSKNLKFVESKKISERLYEKTLEAIEELEEAQKSLKLERNARKETGKVIREIEKELKK